MKVKEVYLPKAEDVELECEMMTGRGIFLLNYNSMKFSTQSDKRNFNCPSQQKQKQK